MNELLTLQEVADELKVSIHTVRQWRRLGQIDVLKFDSGMVRVSRDALDATIAAAAERGRS